MDYFSYAYNWIEWTKGCLKVVKDTESCGSYLVRGLTYLGILFWGVMGMIPFEGLDEYASEHQQNWLAALIAFENAYNFYSIPWIEDPDDPDEYKEKTRWNVFMVDSYRNYFKNTKGLFKIVNESPVSSLNFIFFILLVFWSAMRLIPIPALMFAATHNQITLFDVFLLSQIWNPEQKSED